MKGSIIDNNVSAKVSRLVTTIIVSIIAGSLEGEDNTYHSNDNFVVIFWQKNNFIDASDGWEEGWIVP